MSERRSAARALREIDAIVQFWRDDEVDGPTYTLLQVDRVLCEYFGRQQVNFPDQEPCP